MSESSDDRLVSLEETAAHQAAAIEELSRQLAEQWKLTERLRQELLRLSSRFEEIEDTVSSVPQPQKPPHW